MSTSSRTTSRSAILLTTRRTIRSDSRSATLALVAADKIDEIDFPIFVADLIAGVFQATVDVAIQQMEA